MEPLIRLAIYIYLGYHLYFVNVWLTIAVGICLIFSEVLFFLLKQLKRQVDVIGFAQTQTINTDFGFFSQELTHEESDLVDRVRDGDLVAAALFLKGRCKNKLIDFGMLPEPVRLMLAQRLVNAINRNESPTWEELLSGENDEKTTI